LIFHAELVVKLFFMLPLKHTFNIGKSPRKVKQNWLPAVMAFIGVKS